MQLLFRPFGACSCFTVYPKAWRPFAAIYRRLAAKLYCWKSTGPILRVQVKCTVFRVGKGYSINCFGPKQGPKRCGYAPGTVDFFALYIVPTDDWYIMPYAAMGRDNRTLHFTPDSDQQKYGK